MRVLFYYCLTGWVVITNLFGEPVKKDLILSTVLFAVVSEH